MKMKRTLAAMGAATALVLPLAACQTDADVASDNLSKECDQFRCDRRITAINGVTDKYLFVIEGRCSVKDDNQQLEVLCKAQDGKFKKSLLRLSDNVTYVVQQLAPLDVSTTQYKVIFKPETIIPDVDRP